MDRLLSDRALLVEAHDLLAQSLAKALLAEGAAIDRLRPVSAAAVRAAAREGGHDLVLLDVDRGDEHGWGGHEAVRELIGGLRADGSRVVVLTHTGDAERIALAQGASGVVRKDQGVASLWTALGCRDRRHCG